jgi:hypothetical protein
MISSKFSKVLSRSLLLASGALLFHASAAFAADATGDAQTQARELLGGKTPSRVLASSAHSARDTSLPGIDAQEQARQLLLGEHSSVKTAGGVRVARLSAEVGHEKHRANDDAQTLAQRMILGNVGL